MSTQQQQQQTGNGAAMQPAPQANNQIVSMGFNSIQGFEQLQRAARLLAASTLVPEAYQGNLANCVVALNMANRLQADPLLVMQNLVVVYGKPTWSSQFAIASINTCGKFSPLRYEWVGERDTDSWGCRAWAIELATGEPLKGSTVTIQLAKDEGWYNRNGSKWKTMPEQMLMYRAASWFARAYAPELLVGLHTADEAHDIIDLGPEDYEVMADTAAAKDANGPIIDVSPDKEQQAQPDAKATDESGQAEAKDKPAEVKADDAKGKATPEQTTMSGPGF